MFFFLSSHNSSCLPIEVFLSLYTQIVCFSCTSTLVLFYLLMQQLFWYWMWRGKPKPHLSSHLVSFLSVFWSAFEKKFRVKINWVFDTKCRPHRLLSALKPIFLIHFNTKNTQFLHNNFYRFFLFLLKLLIICMCVVLPLN